MMELNKKQPIETPLGIVRMRAKIKDLNDAHHERVKREREQHRRRRAVAEGVMSKQISDWVKSKFNLEKDWSIISYEREVGADWKGNARKVKAIGLVQEVRFEYLNLDDNALEVLALRLVKLSKKDSLEETGMSAGYRSSASEERDQVPLHMLKVIGRARHVDYHSSTTGACVVSVELFEGAKR